MKVLVGIGCSHTAGTAFLKDNSKSKNGLWLERSAWASKALAEKYKDGAPLMRWVTYNLTWMAKVNKKLHCDKIINLGVGGEGIDVNIMNIKSYIDLQEDLSGHIFIHQLPSVCRVNVVHREMPHHKVWKWRPVKALLREKAPSIMALLDYYYDEDYHTLNNFYELYYLQRQIEKLGGKYYCFSFDMQGPLQSYPDDFWDAKKEIDTFDRFDKYNEWMHQEKIYFEGEKQFRPPFKTLISKLNWLNIDKPNDRIFKGMRLDEAALLPGDHHFSEDGNEVLGYLIYRGMKNEP